VRPFLLSFSFSESVEAPEVQRKRLKAVKHLSQSGFIAADSLLGERERTWDGRSLLHRGRKCKRETGICGRREPHRLQKVDFMPSFFSFSTLVPPELPPHRKRRGFRAQGEADRARMSGPISGAVPTPQIARVGAI
jgi:hypothetical protein